MNNFDPHAYTITVKRAVIEGELLYSASVAELPDVEAFEPTYTEAYEITVDAIKALKDLADEAGKSFPPPLEYAQEYSGRITLRVPTSLHRKLAMKASTERVSLNALIVTKLSEACTVAADPVWFGPINHLFPASSGFGNAVRVLATTAEIGVVSQKLLPPIGETVGTGIMVSGARRVA